MMLTWPDTLPHPERDSWQVQPQDARRKRQSDAGPPAYRRRFSSVAKTVQLSVLLSRDEKAVFDRFFHDDCKEGALLFQMPDPTTDGWPMLSTEGDDLLIDTDTPLLLSALWLCAWGDAVPTETLVGLEFRKSFSVVVMP